MTRFRPCVDILSGRVTQIVGGSLRDGSNNSNSNNIDEEDSSNTAAAATSSITDTPQRNSSSQQSSDHITNHTSHLPSAHFAQLYRENGLTGGHVILLSQDEGSRKAARETCDAWPGEMQVGGGINPQNAPEWIRAGAGKVIVTSFLFPDGRFSMTRLREMIGALDEDRSKLVIDLSCRRQRLDERQQQEQQQETKGSSNSTADGKGSKEVGPSWVVAMNKWQKPTDMVLSKDTFDSLSPYCSEFLVHAADIEGKQQGIDEELVGRLAEWSSLPVTYAGGARSLEDLAKVKGLSGGKVDLTIGSALDMFGGNGVKLKDCVRWNKEQE